MTSRSSGARRVGIADDRYAYSGDRDHQFRLRDQPVRKPPRIGHDHPQLPKVLSSPARGFAAKQRKPTLTRVTDSVGRGMNTDCGEQ